MNSRVQFSDLTSVGDIVSMLYCSEEVAGPGGTTGSPDIGVTVALADQLNLADKLRYKAIYPYLY